MTLGKKWRELLLIQQATRTSTWLQAVKALGTVGCGSGRDGYMSPQTAVSLGLMRAEEAPLLGNRLSGRVAQDDGYDPNLGHRQLRRSDGQQATRPVLSHGGGNTEKNRRATRWGVSQRCERRHQNLGSCLARRLQFLRQYHQQWHPKGPSYSKSPLSRPQSAH